MAAQTKLLVVGCGRIGAALAAGFARAHPAAEVVALDRDPPRARSLLPAASGIAVHAGPEALAGLRPDVVILALRPPVLGDALGSLVALCADALVVSIAADAELAAGIFWAVGRVDRVADEALIDVATAVAGSGPAYFFAVVAQLARAGAHRCARELAAA